jgi:protein-S-isoprenylcysteine O-methyltransferase Ste14
MTSPQPRLRAVLLGIAGVLLIALAAVLHFVMPQLRPEEHLFDETWLLSAGAVRIAAAAAATGGAWLLVLAWNSRPSQAVDDEPAGE